MKTKKFVFPLAAAIVILVIVLVACGSKPNTTSQAGGSNSAAAANGTPGSRNFGTQPLPQAESFVIGTFKLQGTANAVTASQATALIPLWQAYAQLTSSNTAAQAEIDAVVSQIQSTMTPQQVQAITAMKLTRQDLFTTESNLGLSNGFSGTPGANTTPGARTGGGGGFFPGGGDAGGPPGGGGGGFGGGGAGGGGGTTTRPTPNATQIALRAQFANRIPTPLMNALVSYLQKTAGS